MLPQLESEFEGDSSFSYGTECPSLSSSFLPSDQSSVGFHGARRASLASSNSSMSPEVFFTPSARTSSPTTPMMFDAGMQLSYKQYMKPAKYLHMAHPIFHLQDQEQDHRDDVWMSNVASSNSLGLVGGMPDTLMAMAHHPLGQVEPSCLGQMATNPALTDSIFSSPEPGRLHVTHQDLLPWASADLHPPAETVEPSATFQAVLPSSPLCKLEPSTPLNNHLAHTAGAMTSSPLSFVSSMVVPSQRHIEEPPYSSLEESLRFCDTKKHRTNPDRLHRRSYERKRLSGMSSKPKPVAGKSGMNCDLIITKNEFACSYPGCIDKSTGEQKRFKRQEHKKRHEKTVHEREKHSAYRCWVPECNRPFSRTDNLKSHLRNTHSKRPGVRGNRYVATLDKNSEYYDPEWVGNLDKDGYPIV
ncbi:hypothetical protein HRR83_000171 [Exophiala dermatitidis]|uniref:Zinc finger protein BrlA n=2 Tax=Exophiala dermatitidis TaxID=5970 RepID=H6C8I5_EXODN|nr:zinc finger protein BrlA [Exophiala dermatitidis NIH/UT8656]KAJ4523524.1 hypothetical protein HRR73_002707 [Exophiala dermatitidis]EHY60412.1 zinc finger protein BrlA [Exophiala dermatitidis NIH/UT8656]KAJ4527418.1 hypothetical protein HRR74_000172 [Exophiala dermatitidis]KAJ4530983.1 hypothetical protein HRR76_008669 [Exophiala dermatitidis]KAJ4558152.1 hypothetical protein HRR77_000172 [Exophiala dermatitidis]